MQMNKLSELVEHLKRVEHENFAIVTLELKHWALGLQQSGILKLFEIPYFGCSNEINLITKLLLSCRHNKKLWLDWVVEITPQVIAGITSLSISRERHEPLFEYNAKTLGVELQNRFHTKRGKWGFVVSEISEPTIRFSTQGIACKIPCKCKKSEVSIGVIMVATKCV